MTLGRDEDYNIYNSGRYSWETYAELKVTGEVLTAIHLNDGNRGELMRLAKQHFPMDGVVGANDDVIELSVIPNKAVRGLFNSKGGVGTVEVIPAGRSRTEGVQKYQNDILAAQQRADAMISGSRWDRPGW
ncbi:MAG: hypothetical protein AAF988_05580 [Pseudomonadota bacterium]